MTNSLQIKTDLRRWMEVIMTRSMHDWSRYVKSSGLSMPQFRLLMQLFYHGPCGISQISEEMLITNPAASQLVDKLVQGGLLDRAEDPSDRRAKTVTISEKGREFVKNGIEQRYVWINELTEALSEEECESISHALTVLADKALFLQEHIGAEKTSLSSLK